MRLRREQVKDLIRDAAIFAIRNRANEAFIKSQQRCPVKTGELRLSGKVFDEDNGSKLMYRREYASFVERGTRPHWVYINAYQRKDGVHVRSHTKFQPRIEPRRFIRSSMEESFGTLSNTFDDMLRQRFRDVRKEL